MDIKKTAKESLKNSGLVGGSQIVNVILGVIKTKAVALLLGPSGVGLIQLFTSTITLLQNVFSFGLGFSGVRDISESHGTGDQKKLSRTVVTLNRWVWFSGILGTLIIIIFSKKISILTFGSTNYWQDISFLSIAIMFSNLAASKSALVRGIRNMGDFVRINILSYLIGTIISIPIYYFFRENGIISVLIFTSISTYIINYIYSKRIVLPKVSISFKKSAIEGLDMFKLGVFMVIATFITQLSLYYIRVRIGDKLGLDYIGYYTAATTLTVTYMGLIFTAMVADYFPKLSAINKDDKLVNEAVLEQTKIVLLLGTPLILGMYTFSEYIIIILYSSDFIFAKTLLILMLGGVFFRLIGFPIGYVFMAKGKSKIFIFTQTQWNVIFIFLSLSLWNYFHGLTAVGIAFILSYFIGIVVNVIILNRLTNFRYDDETIKYIIIFSILTVVYFLVSFYFSGIYILIVKFFGLVFISIYCFKMLERLIGINIYFKIKSILSKKNKK
tara:strand:- start:15477 stop:16973 length:1497 start_codon:yes stop_codon:yes gene_type:complete